MKTKSILIIGSGYIGTHIAKEWNCPISKRRINTFRDAENLINKYKPRVLINCIGHTGKRNVDDCEKRPDYTLTANTFIPIILAEVCIRHNIKLVHIGSGCIFHYDYIKNRPITETTDPMCFDLFYSRTKIYAERALEILSRKKNILIPRIRIPLDDKPHRKNILTKLLNFKHIIDIPNSISYVPDTIKAIKHLISIDATGIYNVVNSGRLRYPQLLDIYKSHVPTFTYKIIDRKKLPMSRTNLVLSTKKLEKTGFPVRPIKGILKECVKNYLNYS